MPDVPIPLPGLPGFFLPGHDDHRREDFREEFRRRWEQRHTEPATPPSDNAGNPGAAPDDGAGEQPDPPEPPENIPPGLRLPGDPPYQPTVPPEVYYGHPIYGEQRQRDTMRGRGLSPEEIERRVLPPVGAMLWAAPMPRMPRMEFPPTPRGRPTIEGEVIPFPRSRARGPFGTRQQGEIVIVGRRPPRAPVEIGGVPTVFRPGRVIITTPKPLPLPRPSMPPRPGQVHLPPPIELPLPEPVSVPQPLPLPTPEPVWMPLPSPSPSRVPLPLPSPSPSPATPSPMPAPQRAPRPASRPRTVHVPASLHGLGALAGLAAMIFRPGVSARLPQLLKESLPISDPVSSSPIGDPLPAPAGLPTPIERLTPFNAPQLGLQPQAQAQPRQQCKCQKCKPEKERSKPRPCFARGGLKWTSGPFSGQAAGSRCIRFGKAITNTVKRKLKR